MSSDTTALSTRSPTARKVYSCYGEFPLNDTPDSCIDRICGWTSLGEPLNVKEDIQWFFSKPDWHLHAITPPLKSGSHMEWAIKASLLEYMAHWFNRLNDLGIYRGWTSLQLAPNSHRAPAWVDEVEPLEEELVCWTRPPDYLVHPWFKKRNIIAWKGDFDFI
ncbi:hypothetical protein BDZ88DRAFT_92765 [Geranomyces variabilis]|nr:hypothetical protein BDZ88DRAFT_92765 [Geranomyces variabilis]KAJ3141795.1 hypothetical protein HDU90_006141 [Geranomyces variabilis]